MRKATHQAIYKYSYLEELSWQENSVKNNGFCHNQNQHNIEKILTFCGIMMYLQWKNLSLLWGLLHC